MKTLLALAFVLFATAAFAQGPVAYPPETRTMTPAQYYQWATAKNQQLRAEWDAKKTAAKIDQPQYLQGTTTDDSLSWSVANSAGDDTACYGYYRPRPAFDTVGAQMSSQSVRQVQYNNPAYVNPGPLTILNPFCPPPAVEPPDARYEDIDAPVMTIKSKDGKGTLHIKVLP